MIAKPKPESPDRQAQARVAFDLLTGTFGYFWVLLWGTLGLVDRLRQLKLLNRRGTPTAVENSSIAMDRLRQTQSCN